MSRAFHTPTSSTSSAASPPISVWSRGHVSKSSGSSVSSIPSPLPPPRDSFDTYLTSKRLEDVREEEDITSLPAREYCSFDDYARPCSSAYLSTSLSAVSPYLSRGDLRDQDTWSLGSSNHPHAKRQRSLDRPMHSVSQGFVSRFGSISRRFKNRSSAAAPQLSIITHHVPLSSSRRSVDMPFADWSGRSVSASSNCQDMYSPSSMHSVIDDVIPESEVVPICIDRRGMVQEREEEEDQALATTPLLPPSMMVLNKPESPLQSPLQSPSIAPANFDHRPNLSLDGPFSYLPSPPLSTKPSMASMPRSRAQTATDAIPPLYLQHDQTDPWSQKLGHADFQIHPEPYFPQVVDLDNYREFRENWAQARKQYAQHLARTDENYGVSSKFYQMTEEKWESIDNMWRNNDARLTLTLKPQLARLSDEHSESPNSPISLLERPATRIELPQLDKNGKFPGIGDNSIIGPLSIGVAKVPELQRGVYTPPTSPKKRNFFKMIGDVFKH